MSTMLPLSGIATGFHSDSHIKYVRTIWGGDHDCAQYSEQRPQNHFNENLY